MPDNLLAWEIIHRVIQRSPLDGSVRIDHEAVRFLFDLYSIPKNEQGSIYRKVIIYEQALTEHLNQKKRS